MGGRKLVPRISPSKTYSGLFSGITAGAVVSTLFDILLDIKKVGGYHNYEHVFLCSFFMGLLAQFSDLYVSYFKRKFKVKDSGTLIPGHGGFLDRFDSLILTAPILFLFI